MNITCIGVATIVLSLAPGQSEEGRAVIMLEVEVWCNG